MEEVQSLSNPTNNFNSNGKHKSAGGHVFSAEALEIINLRYLRRNDDDQIIETVDEMFYRVARASAEVEFKYGADDEMVDKFTSDFFEVLSNLEALPGGRTLANLGWRNVIPNCVVLHIEDDLKSIFKTLQQAAILQKQGCGLGFPLHLMRPTGFRTIQTQGQSSGPVSFLNIYNTAFGVIKQQNRHGANMALMRVDHPDILEFIHCKDKEGTFTNFNITVGITNEFMEAVKSKSLWKCGFKETVYNPRRITRGPEFSYKSVTEVEITADDILDEIVASAYKTGEPGIAFIDLINETNPLKKLGRLEACNPCGKNTFVFINFNLGEQFLHDGDVCNLGAINLKKFVKDGEIRWDRLRQVTRLMVRMLDNVIDCLEFPVERMNKTYWRNRRIGIGVMGLADMLCLLGIGYDTEVGIKVAEEVMGSIQRESWIMSEELAKSKGHFPNWEKSEFFQTGVKVRNAAITNVAPTGTTALVCDVNGGIEPFFAMGFKRQVKDKQLYYLNEMLMKTLKERGLDTDSVIDTIQEQGTIQACLELPKDIKEIFVTALDIAPIDHLKMQAAFQKYCDNSISKTINFPENGTKEEIRDIFFKAWKSGIKGMTVYRNNCRKVQVLTLNSKKKAKCFQCKAEIPMRNSNECFRCTECNTNFCG